MRQWESKNELGRLDDQEVEREAVEGAQEVAEGVSATAATP